MPTTLKFGRVSYLIYTRAEMIELGLVPNRNMWIGDGWHFCVNCNRHRYMSAMSHHAMPDCYWVCKTCNTHYRPEAFPIVKMVVGRDWQQ